ncbi:AfsR/SARP family transcriptional regulator [Kitasatospora sp. NPDC004289]
MIEARLLGPVSLVSDGVPVNPGGPNGRTLLTALLLSPGRQVPAEQLVLDVWGETAPVRARAQLYSLISRLRGQLRTSGGGVTVSRHARMESYSLDIAPESVDSTRFRALHRDAVDALADGQAEHAFALSEQALECWSGPALSGVKAHGRLEVERRGLEELRLEVLALRHDAGLRLDRLAAVIPGLRSLVAEFPSRRRFKDQLAEALERSGRSAQAWELRHEYEQQGRASDGSVDVVPQAPVGVTTALGSRPAGPRKAGGSLRADSDMPQISLLGPVRAWIGGHEIPLGSPQQRAVLTMLAAQPGGPVSIPELVDGVWGDRPPPQAVAAVRTYMSRLRAVLEPVKEMPSSAARIVGTSDGYALLLPREAIDLHLFEDTLAEAWSAQSVGDARATAQAVTAALDLWRGGQALASVTGPHAEMLRIRLEERRIAAQELRFESELALGGGPELIAELSQTASQHPLRERLREFLMIALYRAGRQAEALGVYADTRKLLIDELGVEPGVGLSAVHARILSADPELLPELPAVSRQAPPTNAFVPRPPAQLPADLTDFTGHHELVHRLTEDLLGGGGPAVQVQVLRGIGGVGKTTLAVHVAHKVRLAFPDGQLYANLRGTGAAPADPATVLGDFLYALGVHDVPDSYEQRAALYRSLLADRRLLVVLDNARDAEQVQSLIPGVSGSAVLVTGRSRLVGMSGVRVWDVDRLTEADALELFAAVVGDGRVGAELEAARAVVFACGLLPLAVRIAAARLASRPRWSVSDLARRLADQQRRLDELQLGNLAVETTIGLGYHQLSSEESRAFRLLSVVDSSELPLYAIAALIGKDETSAENLAEGLVEANMLESHSPGRYRFHDLLLLFAQRQNERVGDSDEQKAALGRLLTILRAMVYDTAQEPNLGDEFPDSPGMKRSAASAQVEGVRDVRDWLNSSRAMILGAVEAAFSWAGLEHLAMDVVVALTTALNGWESTWRLRAILDDAASSRRYQSDAYLLARIRYVQGDLFATGGEFIKAEEVLRESISLLWKEDHPRLSAMVSLRLAGVLSVTGRSGEALPLYDKALEISRRLGAALTEIRILANVARAYVQSGRPEAGVQSARTAVEAARLTGSAPILADALYQLGVVLNATEEPGEAADHLSEALTLYRTEQSRLWECYSLARLAASLLASGRYSEAAAAAGQALAIGQELDAAYCQGLAHAALGEALLRLGQQAAGLQSLREAHSVFERLGVPEAAAVEERLEAIVMDHGSSEVSW